MNQIYHLRGQLLCWFHRTLPTRNPRWPPIRGGEGVGKSETTPTASIERRERRGWRKSRGVWRPLPWDGAAVASVQGEKNASANLDSHHMCIHLNWKPGRFAFTWPQKLLRWVTWLKDLHFKIWHGRPNEYLICPLYWLYKIKLDHTVTNFTNLRLRRHWIKTQQHDYACLLIILLSLSV